MTPAEAQRSRRVADGVVASYIHEIAAGAEASRSGATLAAEPREHVRVLAWPARRQRGAHHHPAGEKPQVGGRR